MTSDALMDHGLTFLRRLFSVLIFLFLALMLFLGWAQGRDFSWALQAEAEARGQAMLGRPVTIDGAIGFQWRVTEVWVFADDVRTEEPEGVSTLGLALEAERAGAILGLLQLIQGNVDLRGIEIRNARVDLPAAAIATAENQTVVEEAVDARANRIIGMLERLREIDIDQLEVSRERPGMDPQIFRVDHLTLRPDEQGLRGSFVGNLDGTAYNIDGHLADLASFLRQDGSAATVTATVGQNEFVANGTLITAWPLEGQFTFDADAGDVGRLAELMGTNLRGAGEGRANGSLGIRAGRADIQIESLTINHRAPADQNAATIVGPVTGAVAVFRQSGAFRAEGELNLVQLDTSLLRAEQVPSMLSAGDGPRRSLADYAVPMSRFDTAAGRINFNIAELRHRDVVLTDVILPVTAGDGVLSLDGASALYRGAPLELSFSADVSDQVVSLDAEMRDFDIGAYLEDTGRRPIVQAPTHIAIDGTGTGRTVREVMQSFTGQSNVSMGEGSLGRGGIDFLAADLLQAFFSDNEDNSTPLRCFVSRIDFEEGLGRSRVFMMDTNLITMTGRGRVFLNENRLDFELSPRPKNPTLLTLAADYEVTGPVLSPSIRPQTGDLIRGVATSVGGLALTGGAVALLPLLNMGDDVENPCIDALAGTAPASVPAEDTTAEEAAEPAVQ